MFHSIPKSVFKLAFPKKKHSFGNVLLFAYRKITEDRLDFLPKNVTSDFKKTSFWTHSILLKEKPPKSR